MAENQPDITYHTLVYPLDQADVPLAIAASELISTYVGRRYHGTFNSYTPRPGLSYCLALSNISIVGAGTIQWHDRTPSVLSGLAVLPNFRQQGIASHIMKNLTVVARNQGAAAIRLVARSGTESFYEKRGYRVEDPVNSPKQYIRFLDR